MLRLATIAPTCLLWLALTWAYASSSQAQPASDGAAYEAALDHALTAHGQGDFAQAERAMREAHTLAPSARTLRGLGIILYAQGRYVEAAAPLEQALVSTEKPLVGDLRAGVVELLGRLFQRISRLRLRIEPADSVLRVDDAEPVLRGDGEVYLMPAEHRIRIEAPQHEPYSLALRTSAGARDSLHVVLARVEPKPELPSTPVVLRAELDQGLDATYRGASERISWWTPVRRRAVLGAGAGITLAGGVSWLVGYLRFVKLKNACTDSADGGCSDSEAERRFEDEHIRALRVTGATLAATGAATMLTALGIELWHRSERNSARLAPSRAGVVLSGQF